jgi:predicted RNase H-like nuclease (RuvC/YqgF family)
MQFQNRRLSIETDLSVNSSAYNRTTTTQISVTPIRSRIETLDTQLSDNKLPTDADEIVNINNRVCSAVKRRLEEKKEAESQLELYKLKKDVQVLKSTVKKLEKDVLNTDNKIGDLKKEFTLQCPSLVTHNILTLKQKLKHIKKKNKGIKGSYDCYNSENTAPKSIITEKPLQSVSLSHSTSCTTF